MAPPPPDKTSSAPSVPDGLPPSYEDAQAIAAINAEMEKKCAGPKTKLNFAACWKKLSGKTKSASSYIYNSVRVSNINNKFFVYFQ